VVPVGLGLAPEHEVVVDLFPYEVESTLFEEAM
jgi:hypothetical protein